MDVGSVKTEPIVHIKNSSLPLSRFVPTHPMAGREVGGAHSARADLFATRSWIITPTVECSVESQAIVREFIDLVGATAILLPADEHDRAVAAISLHNCGSEPAIRTVSRSPAPAKSSHSDGAPSKE